MACSWRGWRKSSRRPELLNPAFNPADKAGVRQCFWVLLLATPLWGQGGLADASLEQLLETRVTTVSKKEQSLSRTAAAVFVIGPEDIRRSGALSLPDLLRMAPGVNEAQINAHTWAISIRGFNSRYSNKVLVLVDGRSVYTPSFSGVYWEHLDLPLEDIERIEVIRGPGASTWGANAVNGVINIITKSSKDTRGALVTATSGTETYASDTLQYGGDAGDQGAYRAFVRYGHEGGSRLPGGTAASDAWTRLHGGFRSDLDLSRADGLMIEGEWFSNREGEMDGSSFLPGASGTGLPARSNAQGGNLMARWSHQLSGGSETEVRAYYDEYRRTDFGVLDDARNFDIEFQDHLKLNSRHDVVWGAGYRSSRSILNGSLLSLTKSPWYDHMASVFFQDEIALSENVWLTPGFRAERDSYIGFHVEPGLRLAWAPSERHTIWGAVARSLRQPSAVDTSVNAILSSSSPYAGVEEIQRLIGNPHFRPESADDFEIGYRAQVTKSLAVDLASFLTSYRDLATIEPGTVRLTAGLPSILDVQMLYANLSSARSYGAELAASWNVTPRWKAIPTYSYLCLDARKDPASSVAAILVSAPLAPKSSAGVRSQINLPGQVEFDQWMGWSGAIPGAGVSAYARFDLRIGRRFGRWIELSVGGQNLLRPGTTQFPNFSGYLASESQRSFYGKLGWSF